ncbi:hypothetical protein GCM10008931_43980 [Oceanobacillus oncorhynchi subsp. oncorhynchi]|uniref:hypothetical protein n=1 Tax=Oceanobacillus oncorhynchi TaxID=545501 RepID=UPI0031D822F3
MEKKNVNKNFPETWEGKTKDYELGNKGFEWKIESENSSATFNLDNGEWEFKNANLTYRDTEGNEISRERFYELRVEKLERQVSQLADELSLKVDADEVINAINISPERIHIKGDKIQINEAL